MQRSADKFHPDRPVLIGHSPCVVAKHDTQQLIDYHVDELSVIFDKGKNYQTNTIILRQLNRQQVLTMSETGARESI